MLDRRGLLGESVSVGKEQDSRGNVKGIRRVMVLSISDETFVATVSRYE